MEYSNGINELTLEGKEKQKFESVLLEINKIIDNDTIYKMETLYQGGMDNFVQYYGGIEFQRSLPTEALPRSEIMPFTVLKVLL